ncbi:MAG: GNAT family N-acetyltransferase [Chloroflexi bacterium]|nr:GNAT family N-acetyltransferase [Chloroflexota bacterium]
MQLTAYHQATLFAELRLEWNDLLRRSASDRIFSTWEWQSTWWDAYQPGQLWVVACRDEHNRLIGLAPWFIENHATLGRVVRSIGCVEVTDYLDVIVDEGYVEPVLHCLAAFLQEHREQYDVVDLCNLPETSTGYRYFPEVLRQHRFEVTVKQQEVCPVIELPDTWDGYLETLDKKQRHEIRRKLRRAEADADTLDWYIVNDTHNLDEETNRFLKLMSASHQEKAGFLADPQNVDFFHKLVPVIYRNGWLQLSFLRVNGKAAATYLNFVYKGQVLVYNSGLLPGEYGHLSPGIVLLAYNIRHAIENGCAVFDFLRGNETYKYRMGAHDTPVFMLQAKPSAG